MVKESGRKKKKVTGHRCTHFKITVQKGVQKKRNGGDVYKKKKKAKIESM